MQKQELSTARQPIIIRAASGLRWWKDSFLLLRKAPIRWYLIGLVPMLMPPILVIPALFLSSGFINFSDDLFVMMILPFFGIGMFFLTLPIISAKLIPTALMVALQITLIVVLIDTEYLLPLEDFVLQLFPLLLLPIIILVPFLFSWWGLAVYLAYRDLFYSQDKSPPGSAGGSSV